MGTSTTLSASQDGRRAKDAARESNRRRRFMLSVRDKAIVTLSCLAITVALGAFMLKVSGPSVWSCLLAACFYFTLLVNAGWIFCILTPFVGGGRRLFNAAMFVVLFVWGCVFYFFAPVEDEKGGGESSTGTAQTNDVSRAASTNALPKTAADGVSCEVSTNSLPKTVVELLALQIAAPNRTLAAFFPSRGGFESVPKGPGKEKWRIQIHYFVFHSVVIFYIALLTFAIFGRGIVNRINKWFIRWERLNVFWGRSDAGLLLARSIIDSTVVDQVFFVLQQRSGDGDEWRTLTKEIDRMGAMWSFSYDSNAVESDVSGDTLAQAKGRRHFFMDESGHVNLSRADRLVKVLRTKKPARGFRGLWSALRAGVLSWWRKSMTEKPYFYVRMDDSADEFVYLEWAANVRDVVNPILLKESRLIAKTFISDHPMLDVPGVKVDAKKAVVEDGEFKTLIIGFGAAGQDILNEIVCNGQFLREDGSTVPFAVDIVEKDEKVVEEYCLRHPEVMREYKVTFATAEEDDEPSDATGSCESKKKYVRVEDETFDKFFKKRLTYYNRIIVCLQGDEKTLSAAFKIVEFSRRFGKIVPRGIIFARVKDPARNRYVPYVDAEMHTIYTRGKKVHDSITLFGNLKEIYSFERINAEEVDKMAKVLNSRKETFWEKVADEQGKEEAWDNASLFDQLSSRASAEGQRNLLRLLGWECVRNADGRQLVSDDDIAKVVDDVDGVLLTLAKTEHLRWNAFHRMMGYRVWDVLNGASLADLPHSEDIPIKIRANQLETIGKHADIVPFDDLPKVDRQIASWKGEHDVSLEKFTGLKQDASQAWDIVFCQMIGKVAASAGYKIVTVKSDPTTEMDSV